jgi:hypothetical protein
MCGKINRFTETDIEQMFSAVAISEQEPEGNVSNK